MPKKKGVFKKGQMFNFVTVKKYPQEYNGKIWWDWLTDGS